MRAVDTKCAEFDALLAEHWPYLRNIAHKYARDRSEDVLQSALLKAWRGLHTFQGKAKMMTWITSIIRNEAIMDRRNHHSVDQRQDLKCLPVEECVLGLGSESAAIRHIDDEAAMKAITEAMRQIPAKHRAAIESYYWQGIGGDISTAKTHRRRGVIALRAALESKGLIGA